MKVLDKIAVPVLALLIIVVMAGSASAVAVVTVIYPNGGENVSGTITITWTQDNTGDETQAIDYSPC